MPVVQIDNLNVAFARGTDQVPALKNLSLHVNSGEVLCLVGKSGSGKSVMSRAMLGLTQYEGGRVTSGQILLNFCDTLNSV